jgi:hypothetical protein
LIAIYMLIALFVMEVFHDLSALRYPDR